MRQLYQTFGAWELVVRHERWNWDTQFGTGGAMLVQANRAYNYDVHHRKIAEAAFGIDVPIIGLGSTWLAYHFVSAIVNFELLISYG